MTHPGGRPRKFKTPEEINDKANTYFAETPIEEWTITGLALALDTTRETLCDYADRGEYSDTVKKIKTKVENSYELSLRKHGRSGDIFGLKNFGWKDKQEFDHTSKGESINEAKQLTDEQLIDRLAELRARANGERSSKEES